MITRIDITALPRYTIFLDKELVEALQWEALHHYDATCREAAHPGGFMAKWNRQAHAEWGVTLDSREMDLLCKICEMSRNEKVVSFFADARLALIKGNRDIYRHHTDVLDSLAP